jgi:L-threonylcarbamoyladenylate synthase
MIYPFTPNILKEAVTLLRKGDLIGLPTETVYGLAGDATQDQAIARIFSTKNRPSFNPLIIHGNSPDAFNEHVIWNAKAEALAESFWPGPLTLVLPRHPSSSLSLLASAGLDSLAIRIPRHPVALTLLEAFGGLIAAPSANLSGKVSPTQSHHVEEDFPDLFILEGEDTSIGLESTIIDLTGPFPGLLRPGGIPREDIEAVVGPLEQAVTSSIKSPGLLKSHYAPRLPLRLNVNIPLEGEAFLAFGPTPLIGPHILNVSENKNLQEAASNLFRMIRLLDKTCLKGMAVAPIPLVGLGVAINDRLERAAAPRGL